jgi:hypothetical protein
MPYPAGFMKLRNFEIREVISGFEGRSVKDIQFVPRMAL